MQPRRPLLAAAIVCFCAFRAPAPLAAQTRDPRDVQPERPTVATHAGTVARGWLELESGVERNQLAGTRNTLSTLVAKIGTARHVQLSFLATGVWPEGSAGGAGDFAAGVKWRVLDAHPLLGDFALLPSLKFPTGSRARDTGTGTTDAALLLISSRDVGAVHVDLNAGYTFRGGSGVNAPRDAWLWAASFDGALAGRAGWTAELFGYPGAGGPQGAAPIVAVLCGPTFAVRRWLVLDVGGVFPLTGPQPHALYAGLVYNVGRLWNAGE